MLNDVIIPIIYGSVQGLSEFLPVSSSGHLVILHNFIDSGFDNDIVFDVILHLSTLLAAVVYFWKDILEILRAMFRREKTEDKKIGYHIILATIPAALAGFLLEDLIENALRSIYVVVFMLVAVAVLFLIVERKKSTKFENYKDLNWRQSLAIGSAQALALVPGTSRSGITMITGMMVGLKRDAAIKFSFLLSMPIILGANLTKIPLLFSNGISSSSWLSLALAFISSFLVGFLSIKYLLAFAKNHRLDIFAYYRILLAVLILIGGFIF